MLNKVLTYYIIDKTGISSNFNKFSLNWWIKRNEAHNFLKLLFNKNKFKYKIGLDYIFTKLINFFLYKKN